MRIRPQSCTRIPWRMMTPKIITTTYLLFFTTLLFITIPSISLAQEFDEFGDPKKPAGSDPGFGTANGGDTGDGAKSSEVTIPKGLDTCDGIYVAYDFIQREKNYPHVKNVTAQSWAFKSQVQLMNMGSTELKSWKVHVGFQHREILVSVGGGLLLDEGELPAQIGKNGTTIAGYPQSDLKTAIETAGDVTQMSAKVDIKGTQFGVGTGGTPMPKSLKLVNDGFRCPAPTKTKSTMYMCCRKDPKFKLKKTKNKFAPRRFGDLNIMYDVVQAYGNNYLAQVTMDNNHPLGRLDHWNLTWEWMRGEFIYTMRGAFTPKKDSSECIYGAAGQYYQDLDFSQVMNCQKKPIINDLPREKKDDEKVGKLPFCCRNGTLLPKTMNETEARSIFQLQVFKLPPDMNRTAIYPPQNWKIEGVINPHYKCGPPVRVDPTEFPDPSGLSAKSLAVASWQITCNITKPKPQTTKCCVTFSSYYNESVVPCNTCACGCNDIPDKRKCSKKAPSMLLPPQALLLPFDNRTAMALAWAKMKHLPIWEPMPCPDNCGVTINWHVDSDFNNGWTARMTLFNWGDVPFEDWFTAVQLGKAAKGYERVYSFNGTLLKDLNNMVMFQGLPGLNYLIAETNGSKPHDPRVPGKQQSVISFQKKLSWNLNIPGGDGFPTKVLFNGEECALPRDFPRKNAAAASGSHQSSANVIMSSISVVFIVASIIVTDWLL